MKRDKIKESEKGKTVKTYCCTKNIAKQMHGQIVEKEIISHDRAYILYQNVLINSLNLN